MFEFLKKVLQPQEESVKKADDNLFKLQVSVCVLLVDIAKIDGDFSDDEKSKITSILTNSFQLEEKDVPGMIRKAEEFLRKDDSIYDFTQVINNSLNNEDKYELLKNLWRLVYVDKNKDMYEEHLVKKIGGLLDLDNRDVIAARMNVEEELKTEKDEKA